MAGISCDLLAAQAAHPAYQKLAAVDEHIRQHYAQPISLAELTAIAGLFGGAAGTPLQSASSSSRRGR